MQPDSPGNLLLQLCAVRRSIRHHASASASPERHVAHIVLEAHRRTDVNSLLQTLHWLPVEQRINYKLAVLTFKTQQTSSLQYQSQYISLRTANQRTQHSIVVRPTAAHAIFDGHHSLTIV